MLDKLKSAFGNLSLDRFKDKLGGVPIWVWGIVLGLIVGIALYIYRKKNPSTVAEGEAADGVASLFDQAEAEQVSAAANQASYAAGLADAVVSGSSTSAVAGSGGGSGYSGGYGGGGGGVYSGGQAAPPAPATPTLKVGLQTSGVSKSFAGLSGSGSLYGVPGPTAQSANDNPFGFDPSFLTVTASVPGRGVRTVQHKEGISAGVGSTTQVASSSSVGSKTMTAAATYVAPTPAPSAPKVIPKATPKKGVTPAPAPAPKKGISGTASGSIKKGI